MIEKSKWTTIQYFFFDEQRAMKFIDEYEEAQKTKFNKQIKSDLKKFIIWSYHRGLKLGCFWITEDKLEDLRKRVEKLRGRS